MNNEASASLTLVLVDHDYHHNKARQDYKIFLARVNEIDDVCASEVTLKKSLCKVAMLQNRPTLEDVSLALLS